MQKTIITIVMAILCLIFSSKAQSPNHNKPTQKQSVTGKVISATTSEALPGAIIKNTSTNQSLTTNNDGDFTLHLPNGSYNLAVSYLSYKAKNISIQIPLKEKLIISLETNEQNLKEVEINAGYYTVKDKERTGSISRVTTETISKQPVSNPLAALIGHMAGVNIEQQSGINGGGFKVEIRGVNSLRTDGRQPLYLVDGVPYPASPMTNSTDISISGLSLVSSPLNYISPADIESIEVLKDADATAIYGSQGANGVILIKTKSAKAGKTTADYNVNTGYAVVSSKLDLLNTAQYLKMRMEAFKNDDVTPSQNDYDVNGTWDKNRYTDWQKLLIGGTAHNTSVQASVNGGTEFSQFMLRGNYNKQGTVTPGSFADQKGAFALTANHTSIDKKLKLNFSANYAIDYNNLPQYDLTQYINLAPNAPPIYDAQENLNWAPDANGATTWENPIASTLNAYTGKTNSYIANGYVNYEIVPGLSIRSNLGYTNIRLRENLLNPIAAQAPSSSATGSNSIAFNNIETWIIELQLNYQRKIGKGLIDVLIGSTFQATNQKSEYLVGAFTSDLLLESIAAAFATYGTAAASQYRYNAIFSRINYNYEGKYILNLTGRRDGSSRFGPGKQFANFGAAGLAWIFSKENFAQALLPLLSFGKIRGSYGLTGSDQIPNYGYLETYTATPYPYQDGGGLLPSRIANPDYSWETNKKLELALDLGFVNNRILLTASRYRNRSSNQLVGYTLPDITGFTSVQYNLPATVQNSGWEFELNTYNISNKVFTWNTSANFSIPRNKLLAYPNLQGSTYANTYIVGQSLYTPRSYHYLGVDPKTGIYIFEDVNGSKTVDNADRKPAPKSLTSHAFGGIQNSFTYKGFGMDIFFQFVNKTLKSPYSSFTPPGTKGNQLTSVLERWQNEGDQKPVQQFSQSLAEGSARRMFDYLYNADNFVDGSFVRLKNIMLSWNAPNAWLRKIKLNSLKLYIQGQNLFTITKYPGDPEAFDIKTLPALTTITTGIQINL